MKIMRLVVILLVIAAVASIGAFLYSKRTVSTGLPTIADNTFSIAPNKNSAQQTPSTGEITISNTNPTREIVVEASEYKFTPSTVTIKKGESVKITLKNAGAMPHDWFVENMGGASIDMTSAGSTNSIVIKASQTGTFTTYCSIGSHRKLGMVGKLIVQ